MATPIKPSIFSKDLIHFLRTCYQEIQRMSDEDLCTNYTCNIIKRGHNMLGAHNAMSVIVHEYCLSVGGRVTKACIPISKNYIEKCPYCRSIIERRRGFITFALKYLDWMESEYYSAESK